MSDMDMVGRSRLVLTGVLEGLGRRVGASAPPDQPAEAGEGRARPVVHHGPRPAHHHVGDGHGQRVLHLVLLHHLQAVPSLLAGPHLPLQVVEDEDLVVDVQLVVLDEAGGGGVRPLDLPHVLPQLPPEEDGGSCKATCSPAPSWKCPR